MKMDDLKYAFGSTPESVKECVLRSLHEEPRREKAMKRKMTLSLAIALALVLVLCPLLRRAKDSPALMRGILLAMLLLAGGYLAFVSLYPFPADVDAANLASGTKNAYTMLGCMAGLWLTYEVDVRRLKFDTQAPLAGQALKLALGFGLLLAIKAGAKAPLRALFANDYLADGIRYFLMVAFAGCIWPLTFRFFKKLGKK